MSLFIKNFLSQTGLLLLFITTPAGVDVNVQLGDGPNLQTLLDQVRSKHQEMSARLRGYTYTLKRTEQELNDKGAVKREQVKVFQVYPTRRGGVVTVLLSEDGKELSPDRLSEEKARANREWQKQKKEAENNPDREGVPGVLSFFPTSEFSVIRSERHGDREVRVLSFKPRDDFKPSNDSEKFTAKLEGEVWIDVAEKVMVKLDARLAKSYRAGGIPGFFSALKPGTSLIIENVPLTNGLWVTARVELALSETGTLFSRGRRDVQKQEMSGHKPFDQEADHLY